MLGVLGLFGQELRAIVANTLRALWEQLEILQRWMNKVSREIGILRSIQKQRLKTMVFKRTDHPRTMRVLE